MGKNVLILTGSPRKGGNSEMLADAFIKGAQSKGHTTEKFETAMKKIGGCRACDACWNKDNACSVKDDFAELEPLLEKADVIVFVTPLYWYGMSSQLKAAIDKFYAYASDRCKRKLKIRESAFLICGGDDEKHYFNGAVETYKGIAGFLKWNNLGVVIGTNVFNKGTISETDFLEQAELLGKSIE